MKNKPLIVLCCLIFSFQIKICAQNFSIEFINSVGNKILKLDSANYINSSRQSFTVTKFRYYIGDITLTGKKGIVYSSNDYFLVDEENAVSKKIVLSHIPKGEYSSISFILGVDSMHNCSGAQSGALDPLNGMFWTWNTGYVFLKLEGKSAASPLAGNLVEYHIGGYKSPYNSIRRIVLALPGNTLSLKINADIAKLFNGAVQIDFAKLPSVTDATKGSMLADNYADMFTIQNE